MRKNRIAREGDGDVISNKGEKWTLTAWSKNLTNKIYNVEFSPGNVGGAAFLWRALPRRYGLDLDYRF
jgi:outer membrane receptor protein involved in Fe transport